MKTFEIISEEIYNSISLPIIFEDIEINRRFAIFRIGNCEKKISWFSDIMNPSLIINNTHVYLAIDLNFAVICKEQCSVVFYSKLNTNFCLFINKNNLIFIVTEYDFLFVNLKESCLELLVEFGEIYWDHKIHDNVIEFEFIDNSKLKFDMNNFGNM